MGLSSNKKPQPLKTIQEIWEEAIMELERIRPVYEAAVNWHLHLKEIAPSVRMSGVDRKGSDADFKTFNLPRELHMAVEKALENEGDEH